MLIADVAVRSLAVVLVSLGAGVACGQNFPVKPVRIYTGSAGGSNDTAVRLIAQGIAGPLGQPVIIENRGSGALAAPIVAKSPPDGYSLLFGSDIIWLGPLLRGQSDAMREFSPVSLVASAPNILVVHPSLPAKSVKELIALAKARPGDLNFSSSGAGSTDHIAGELFKSLTGINMVWVPFKGSAAGAIAVAAGEVQLMFGGVFLVSPHVKSGRLRALAVTSVQPSALAAGLPTIAESGVAGYELVSTDSLFAPANTPAAIVNQLNQEVVRFLRTKDAQERYLTLGSEVVASSAEEHAAKLKSRIVAIGKLIRDAGIRVD